MKVNTEFFMRKQNVDDDDDDERFLSLGISLKPTKCYKISLFNDIQSNQRMSMTNDSQRNMAQSTNHL